jgi:hypothetical protein
MDKKFIGLVVLIITLGCSDLPPREKFPGGQGRTTDADRAESTRAVLGGFDPLAQASTKVLKGVVNLAKNAKIPAQFTVFVSVRPLSGGPPLAAKKMNVTKFPFEFTVSEGDKIMMGGDRPFDGMVDLTVRVDQDGNPLSQEDGNLMGAVQVQIPKTDIQITLEPVI